LSANTSQTQTAIAISGSLSLDNFVVPGTQDEFDAVVNILETTISQIIRASLLDNQNLSSVDVLSVGGQTGVRRRPYLESTEIVFVMTLVESCTVNCGSTDSTSIAAALYDQVTTDLTEKVLSGAFVSDIKSKAESDENAGSLAQVVVLSPTYEEYVLQTQSPTKSPSLMLPSCE
jgi:hypothetical protein